MSTTTSPVASPASSPVSIELDQGLERKGRWWLFGSFVFCPCHLPLTLALFATVFGGTTLGVVVRDHAWLAGAILTASWIAGSAYGFRLLRRAKSGVSCPVPR